MELDCFQILSQPFDVAKISAKRKQIKRSLLSRTATAPLRVAVLGGSTTSELVSILELFLLREGFAPVFHESEYGRFYEEAVVDNQALREFKPDVAIVHTTSRNIRHFPEAAEEKAKVEEKLDLEFERFRSVWDVLLSKFGCLVVQNNFDPPPFRILGNSDSVAEFGRTNFVNRLNLKFAEYAKTKPGILINDLCYLAALVGLQDWYEENYWFSYKLAVGPRANVFLADNIAKILRAAYGKSRKCLVLDLDNTLWGGVIGDDGVMNLRLGNETPDGEAYVAFQQYCRELKNRGVLLAVCSKNDVETAKEGFSHPDSVLRVEDFAAFEANWEPKYQNLERIAKALNLGMESLVFVDDNPAEREIVAAQLSMVAVPEIGNDPSRFVEILDRQGYFEALRLSSEDVERTQLYGTNKKREALVGRFKSYDEYLQSLEMQAEIDRFGTYYMDRIAQLTNKTNQFNLTTRRYTATQLQTMASDAGYITLYGRLKDKFGDNGVISVIAGKIEGQELHVLLWLMSCRVLKRGMEAAMLDALVCECVERGITVIHGYYFKSAKNSMVSNHYGSLGFSIVSSSEAESVWRLDLTKRYENQNKFIEVVASYASSNHGEGADDLSGRL
jgi:FkbH-like protein